MSSTTHVNGCLLLLFLGITGGCASSSGAYRALDNGPLSGSPRAILRVPPTIHRGQPYPIELAIVGHPRYESLQQPIAINLTILDGRSARSVVTWGEPRRSRYYKWDIPGRITSELRQPYATIHIAVHHLAGYTLTGKPILTEPFLWTARRVKVQHPIAGGGINDSRRDRTGYIRSSNSF